MGSNVSISDALFSRTQQRLLGLLFGQPQRSYYLKELIERAGMGRGTVQRELARLEASGLVLVTRVGNQKHFQANSSSPVFAELRGLVIKTFGMVDVIREALVPFDKAIECAFIYGSIARGEDSASSDIDLFVVSELVTYSELMSVLADAGDTLGRAVNPSIYARQDIRKKIKNKNAFLTRVMEQPKIWVKGSADDIKELKKQLAKARQQMEQGMVAHETISATGDLNFSQEYLFQLVKRYHIRHLSLFGSAARGELGPDSDIDLLVEFEEGKEPSLGGMVEIQDAFEALFGRRVDVATPSILNNPYRRRAIEKEMKELYAA